MQQLPPAVKLRALSRTSWNLHTSRQIPALWKLQIMDRQKTLALTGTRWTSVLWRRPLQGTPLEALQGTPLEMLLQGTPLEKHQIAQQ
jgi:hypothetical protein